MGRRIIDPARAVKVLFGFVILAVLGTSWGHPQAIIVGAYMLGTFAIRPHKGA